MKVKLSYTVEEEEILLEASKLLGLQGTTMQKIIDLYTGIQTSLKSKADALNIDNERALFAEFHEKLAALELRMNEVQSIVEEYHSHVAPAPSDGAVERSEKE